MIAEFYNCICCQSRPIFPNPYNFSFGEGKLQENLGRFQKNEIKTTKYNIVNFLPKSIISQYQRLANLYFLIVAIISTIPDATPLNPAFIWTPLTIVLFISILKQLYEDYSRYKTDRQVNDIKQVTVLREGKLQQIKWKNIVVGDVCLIKEQQMFPADLLLISTSSKDGIAFIQTSSLDGQQTSKIRYAFQELNMVNKDDKYIQINGKFQGELPNISLNQFKGTLFVDNVKFPVTDCSQLLFRGSRLKNTQWIWGLVIYTGQCSKIMMNGQNFVTKLSTVEKRLNYLLIVMLIIQIVICLVMAALSSQKELSMRQSQNYILWRNYGKSKLFVMNFLLFFVQYSSLIPVSLIVSIEIAKTAQSYFIDFDQLMYSSWRKKKAYARTAALNEELGQIDYIFCDKTGTLTKNELKFHTAIIGNKFFQFRYKTQSKSYQCEHLQSFLQKSQFENLSLQKQLSFQNKDEHILINNYTTIIDQYLMCLLVCNNANTIEGENNELIYQSQSPDELALIQLAKSCRYRLLKRQKNSILVEIQDKIHKIDVIARFHFTSDRKRMSVLINWKGFFFLYTKGADNVIFQRAKDSPSNIGHSIDKLSSQGLRSLLVAIRLIDQEQVAQFITDLQSSSAAQREFVMEQYAAKFQKDLTIVGATGLLDELQNEVAQTLRDFQRAQIKVWMLTGDKLETAIQVGKTCGLIEPQYQVILLKPGCLSIEEFIMECNNKLHNSLKKHCLVVEGSVLAEIFNNQYLQKPFAQLTLSFASVICCRMLPVQKSQAVKMVKTHLNKICLAVGDGGNDVSMIKQANIGIGVYGQQGMNAVQACDYAIPEFRMLWRLIFVHGRWNYMRICQMVLYFCYKSIIFTVPRMLFSFINAYSGQPIYDDFYIALYNILFTSLPLLVRALFEQDINYVYLKTQKNKDKSQGQQILCQAKHLPLGYGINYGLRKLFPKIYFVGQQNHMFNLKQCMIWLGESLLMGICIFLIVKRVLGSQSLVEDGYNGNMHIVSITFFTSIMIVGTLKLCMQVKYWTKLLLFTILFLSLVPYFGFMWLVNYKFKRPIQGVLFIYYTSVKTYFSILLLVLILIGINSILIYIRFHSNRILKKMAIALVEDDSILSFISNKKDGDRGSQDQKLESNQMIRIQQEQKYNLKQNEYFMQLVTKEVQVSKEIHSL